MKITKSIFLLLLFSCNNSNVQETIKKEEEVKKIISDTNQKLSSQANSDELRFHAIQDGVEIQLIYKEFSSITIIEGKDTFSFELKNVEDRNWYTFDVLYENKPCGRLVVQEDFESSENEIKTLTLWMDDSNTKWKSFWGEHEFTPID